MAQKKLTQGPLNLNRKQAKKLVVYEGEKKAFVNNANFFKYINGRSKLYICRNNIALVQDIHILIQK